MPKDLYIPGDSEVIRAEPVGALPKAPLAMPRQVLEHPMGRLARLRLVWDGWLRAHVLGN
ncbi:hypothetical protein [Solirhodobacter olei]|uniref:hypothetical protein n=1 Tax=Solirhodobacter olei TaxID=2493082 RepID=UPI000FDA544A|nr:hypothetical protein [Solirhodobacter olei]